MAVIAAVLVLSLCIGSLTHPVEPGVHAGSPGLEYGIVVDAGSSGSRVRVYSWPLRSHEQEVPLLEEVLNYKVRPGLSALAGQDTRVETYLLRLLQKALGQVPPEQQADTPVYFMSTAGMRLLRTEDADHIMELVDGVLSNSSHNPFLYDSSYCRILSGEEESAFAWVAINYLRGVFTQDGIEDVGVLELGGASTQIAFVPEGSLLAGKFPVFLAGREYPLYVHSYLGYGYNYVISRTGSRARHRSRQDDVTDDDHDIGNGDEEDDDGIENPCMLRGDSTIVLEADGGNVHLVGTGDPEECRDIINHLLYKSDVTRCQPRPCAIGPFYQPNIPANMDFYAISAFVYTPEALDTFRSGELLDAERHIRPDALLNATYDYCTLTMGEAMVGVNETERYLSSYCSMGLYMGSLFTRAYGFHGDTDHIKVSPRIKGKPIAWPIGALLYEMQYLPVPRTLHAVTTSENGVAP